VGSEARRSYKLRKAPISSVMSIHPCDRKCHCVSTWRKFYDIWYRGLTQNSVDKLKIWFKSDDNISATLFYD